MVVELLFVLGVGLAAGTLSGIVGFGSSIMLMPVLGIVFGPLHAVPIMAIAAILANLSRVLIWGREGDSRAGAAYAVTGAPAAAPGARTLPGLITGASLMAGAWIAKRFVLRMHPDRFRLVMDALMLLSGLTMLWIAYFGVRS